jgi:hypothetical protein
MFDEQCRQPKHANNKENTVRQAIGGLQFKKRLNFLWDFTQWRIKRTVLQPWKGIPFEVFEPSLRQGAPKLWIGSLMMHKSV